MDIKGLTDKEVKESREKFGSNEIPDSEPTTFWQEFKETFQDPMIKILLAIAVLMIVMFFFGYAEIYEPMGTIIAVLIVAFVTAKTGVASDTKYRELKKSTKKDQCKVHRNGVVAVIDVDDVVVLKIFFLFFFILFRFSLCCFLSFSLCCVGVRERRFSAGRGRPAFAVLGFYCVCTVSD